MTKTRWKLDPSPDRIIVKPLEESRERDSGLIIPDTAQHQRASQKGLVQAVGEDVSDWVVPGAYVFYSRYGGAELRLEEDSGEAEYLILQEKEILAVFREVVA